MHEGLLYGSKEEIDDILGAYLPGDPDDYDLEIDAVSDRNRGSDDSTVQSVTYEAENDLGQGSLFTVTWVDGEREDLVFEDDPVEYLEGEDGL